MTLPTMLLPVVVFLAFLQVEGFIAGPTSTKVPSILSFRHPSALALASSSNNYKRKSFHRRDQLHRVIQSIQYYGDDEEDRGEQASPILVEAVQALADARTQRDIIHVGRRLQSLPLSEESTPIQERLLKATAMSGLLHISLGMLDDMLLKGYLPSYLAYNVVLGALRRAGRVEQLEDILRRMARVAAARKQWIHEVAFNTYVASLCDRIESPGDPKISQLLDWFAHPEQVMTEFQSETGLTTYNTVLHIAAKVGNKTAVDQIWDILTDASPDCQPDIRSFNARLTVAHLPDRLAILEEIKSDPRLVPDQYTIDLMLLSLVQAGRVDEVEEMLDSWIRRNSASKAQRAFSAFLTTLVQKGEVSIARQLFDTYIGANLTGNSTSAAPIIQPDTRHFNIIIDGYRRVASGPLSSRHADSKLVEDEEAYDKSRHLIDQMDAKNAGREMFRMLREYGKPDSYTLASIMDLCNSVSEIVRLLQDVKEEVTPPVVRAAITACGRLGDPSSACVVFDQYGSSTGNARICNVLLGALADGSSHDTILDTRNCTAMTTSLAMKEGGFAQGRTGISSIVQGLTCREASLVLLSRMRRGRGAAQKPNSQTYCLVASSLQYGPTNTTAAMELFRSARQEGIPADGRFLNAIFRCFGDNLELALESWKSELRAACLVSEKGGDSSLMRNLKPQSRRTNLMAAYNGLLHVCGRALNPAIALRIVYAMKREGLEPNEISLNNYLSGKRARERTIPQEEFQTGERQAARKSLARLLPQINMQDQYENLLYVECTKYNCYDNRMSKDKRLRIIV